MSLPFPLTIPSTVALLAASLFGADAATAQSVNSQPHDLGFWNADQWVPLQTDGSSIGLRFADGMDQAQIRQLLLNLPQLEAGQAEAAQILLGHTVYLNTQADTSPAQAWQLCQSIQQRSGVMSASPRLWAPFEDPYYLTEEILVRWNPETSLVQREALTSGLVLTATLDYTQNPGDVYRVPAGGDVLALSNTIAESGLVAFCLPDFQLLRVTYAGTNDPYYPNQWHLESTGPNGAGVDQDIDVEGAWDITRGTSTVVVAAVDTGVELLHPDLVENLVQGIDVLGNDNNPQAEDGRWLIFDWEESHSTSVSGVIAARGDNGIGVTGVAPRCKVMPIRFLSELFGPTPTVQDEADAFNFACANGAAVLNNSWGPAAGATLPASTRAAIDNCNQNGRGGLGSIIFFAAGNSGSNNSNNGYAAYAGVLGVTAVNDQGVKSSYSSYGPTVDVCAPSNGGVNGITTTDRLGTKGYDNGDYTDGFGGTSSASPTAAGVMALILSANPGLSRQEAIEILLTTTDIVDPANGNYDVNGHSDWYGYGRANAAAAVAEAASRAAGGVSNTIYLNGETFPSAGSTVGFTFSQAPANTPYYAVWSTGAFGVSYQNHLFDVNSSYQILASGFSSATGTGTFGTTLPPASAGLIVLLEVAALDPVTGGWTDSNGHMMLIR